MSIKSLRERDGQLLNNWYIACLADELKSAKPIRRVVYDRPYAIFRDEQGKPAAVPDRCLHRAAKLSEGWCEKGKLVCPYHGWAYNRRGEVVDVPSEGPREGACDTAIRPNLKFTPVPCVEQDGCVWIWTGEGEPSSATPPWRFPHSEDPSFSKYFMITDFENEVTHLAENFMDVPHTVFVHKGWFRTRAMKQVPMTLRIGEGRVTATYHQENDSIGFSSRIVNPKGNPMRHVDEFIFPNITNVEYDFGPQYRFVINSQITPVGTLKSRAYTYIGYRVGMISKLLYPFMRFYTRQVIEQDVDIMRIQGSNFREDFSTNFKSTEADEVHIAIERLREMGVQGDPAVHTFSKLKEKQFWI